MVDGIAYSAWGESPEDAERRLKEILWLEDAGRPDVVTLRHLTTRYISHIQHTSDRYQVEAIRTLAKFERLMDRPAEEITRATVQAEFNRFRGYKRSTLLTFRKFLHAVFELAAVDGLILGNPCRMVQLPRETFTPKPIFTAEEIAALIHANDGFAILPFLALGGLLGVGPSEVASLSRDRFKDGFVTVPGTKAKGRYRVLPMPEGLFGILAYTPFPWFYHSSNSNRALTEACKRAGVKKDGRTLYSLRHSCASGLGELGCPHDFIARLLGHSNKTMTMHYTKLSADATRPYVDAWAQIVYAHFGNFLGISPRQGSHMIY